MPPAPLLRTARIPESTIPRALCAAGQRRGPVVPASVHRSAAALPGSAVDRARVAPGSESSGPQGKSTRVGASSARGRVSGLRAHTVDWRAARRPPAIPGAPSRVRPESALGSTQCACPSPPRPSRPPTLCRRGSFFLESVVLCAPWVMTSWDASLLAERAFLYGVVTRISTETNTHSLQEARGRRASVTVTNRHVREGERYVYGNDHGEDRHRGSVRNGHGAAAGIR